MLTAKRIVVLVARRGNLAAALLLTPIVALERLNRDPRECCPRAFGSFGASRRLLLYVNCRGHFHVATFGLKMIH